MARVAWDRACGRSPAGVDLVCSGGSGSAGLRRPLHDYFVRKSRQADGRLGQVQNPLQRSRIRKERSGIACRTRSKLREYATRGRRT